MVDPIGSNLPPSVQAVNKARGSVQTQRSEGASNPSDEVSLSAEAQEIGEANRLASEIRGQLQASPNEALGRGEQLDTLL